MLREFLKRKEILIIFIILISSFFIFQSRKNPEIPKEILQKKIIEPILNPSKNQQQEQIEIVAENLTIPWEIAFLPDEDILVTERSGNLKRIGKNKKDYLVEGVQHVGEGGLLGLALHPNFSANHYVYLYITTKVDDNLINRVERYQFFNDELKDREIILSDIPGAVFHDGGKIAFGPDGMLYITTGDAGNGKNAQDKNSLAGKILRIKDDGGIPSDNPFGNAIYSFGHRNPQSLVWDRDGNLWSTEHGRSGVLSGFDELNLIKKGQNYGWPEIQGDEIKEGMNKPVLHSGSKKTWAPAGAAIIGESIFFGGLRGESLYEVDLKDPTIAQEHFVNTYGRIRSVTIDPNGMLYISTSNTDGRGTPHNNDDKIIKINPILIN